jgi:predicted nuclease with RNAse H fold
MKRRHGVTVGVDLAASARRTAVCRVVWSAGDALTAEFVVPEGDEELLGVVREADKTGLDCPLGWPSDFVATIAAHHRGARLPSPVRFEARADGRPGLDALRFRLTDDLTWKATSMRPPLSVSTDLLGVVALRAAYLLDALAAAGVAVPRDGSGPVAEVYPAAALRRWGIRPIRSYKNATPEARALREDIVRALEAGLGLPLSEPVRAKCADSHDHLDALVCALVARAVQIGDTVWPHSPEERAAAGREGWIHLPTSDLDVLGRERESQGRRDSRTQGRDRR